MERWVRTGSGFRAQGTVERKNPNKNPDVTDWFRLEGRGSGNFAWDRIGNVATVGTDENIPVTEGSRSIYATTSAFCSHICFLLSSCCIFACVLRLESERVVKVGA